MDPYTRPAIDVLIVCTGNICRSPMAEVLLRSHLNARGVHASVGSAGSTQWNGGADPGAVEVMRERGLDLTAHRARPLSREVVESADLVLGMTRAHLWAAACHGDDVAARAFLIPEIVRLGQRVGPRQPDEDVARWIARLDAARPVAPVAGHAHDEVEDPLHHPIEVYRATADRLDRELGKLADLLTGSERSVDGPEL